MKSVKYIAFLYSLFLFTEASAQISTNEKPVSFGLDLEYAKGDTHTIQTITMPALDMAKIEAEDMEDEEYNMPPRFGYRHKVNYDLTNSGTWKQLSNGDKLWRLNIVCPGALSVNFCYDKFWIPEGGKLFIYSKDRKHVIGAFTDRNNKGDKENVRGFATGLVYGDDVILEYYQPKQVPSEAIISIDYVVHGYRFININNKSLVSSGNCQVNINCEEGQNWQYEKRAVSLIMVGGNRWCTGSLINTTSLSQEPLFLTANHCISDFGDALGNTALDNYIFYWNYESPGCTNDTLVPVYCSTGGATILSNNNITDFALLRLTENPCNLSSHMPFFLGWDNSGDSGDPGVCIHHPLGDVKKISTVATKPTSYYWPYQQQYSDTHWKASWKATQNGHGTTENVSSGSPLLTAAHKVIGQLHGSNCNGCVLLDCNSLYGRFDRSWTGYGYNNIHRRLNCWLDSLNTGVQSMEGLLVIPTSVSMSTEYEIFSNICIKETGQLTIQNNIEMMGTGRIIVESGGKLVVDGGTLSNADIELKAGSSLQIRNGGIIETRNGFTAPAEASVYIEQGEII